MMPVCAIVLVIGSSDAVFDGCLCASPVWHRLLKRSLETVDLHCANILGLEGLVRWSTRPNEEESED